MKFDTNRITYFKMADKMAAVQRLWLYLKRLWMNEFYNLYPSRPVVKPEGQAQGCIFRGGRW